MLLQRRSLLSVVVVVVLLHVIDATTTTTSTSSPPSTVYREQLLRILRMNSRVSLSALDNTQLMAVAKATHIPIIDSDTDADNDSRASLLSALVAHSMQHYATLSTQDLKNQVDTVIKSVKKMPTYTKNTAAAAVAEEEQDSSEHQDELSVVERSLSEASAFELKRQQHEANDATCVVPGDMAHMNVNACNIDRRRNLSVSEFHEQYVVPGRPVILQGYAKQFDWRARKQWTLTNMRHGGGVFHKVDMEYHDQQQSLASVARKMLRANGYPVPVRAKMGVVSPDALHISTMYSAYHTPPLFSTHDMFASLRNRSEQLMRAGLQAVYPNKYLVLGPSHGGCTLHKDYWDTSFWNVPLSGCKKWLLLPPSTVANHLTPFELQAWKEMYPDHFFGSTPVPYAWTEERRTEVAGYIRDHPNRKSRLEQAPYAFLSAATDTVPSAECTQHTDDVLYVPGGWYHVTVNLMPSVSVTENLIYPEHVNHIMHQVCFNNTEIAARDEQVLSSIYTCVALRQAYPLAWKQSCCATTEFALHLNTYENVIGYSILDTLPNADYYRMLLDASGGVRVGGKKKKKKKQQQQQQQQQQQHGDEL